jgi:hypothetical protein
MVPYIPDYMPKILGANQGNQPASQPISLIDYIVSYQSQLTLSIYSTPQSQLT